MLKIVEIYYKEDSLKNRLDYYKMKGLVINKTARTAKSQFLDIALMVRGRNIIEKLEGGLYNTIEFDYMPSQDVMKKAKMIAESVVVNGIEYY